MSNAHYVELGPGSHPEHQGYTTVDYDSAYSPSIVCNFAVEALPFADATVAHLYAKFVIEHLSSAEVIHLLCEIHRVLRPDGRAELIVPEFSSPRAVDFFHKTYYTEESFRYFDVRHSKSFSRLTRLGPFPVFVVEATRSPDMRYEGHSTITFTLHLPMQPGTDQLQVSP